MSAECYPPKSEVGLEMTCCFAELMLQPVTWVWIAGENTAEVQHLGSVNAKSIRGKDAQDIRNISQEIA